MASRGGVGLAAIGLPGCGPGEAGRDAGGREASRPPSTALADPDRYPREHVRDERTWGDEALRDVRMAFHRWPDCSTLESTVADIFRLEGVTDGPDEARVLALRFPPSFPAPTRT